MPSSLDSFWNPPWVRAARHLIFARYGFALGCTLAAIFAWNGIATPLSDFTPYQVLLPFVALAAWFGGTGPGLLCTIFCAMWALAHSDGELISLPHEIEFALFFPVGAFIAALCGSLGRARALADETAHHLAQSQKRYQSIVETASEGIWTIDKDLNTTFANARMAELLGTTPDAMLGRPLTDWMFFEDREILAKNLADGKLAVSHQAELRYRRANGEEIWFLVSATPLPTKNEEFEGTLALHTDISARRAQDAALRASYQRFETATRAVNGYIYEVNAKKGEIYRSTGFRDVLGYDPATLSGDIRWWLNQIHPDDRAAFNAKAEEIQNQVSHGDTVQFTNEYRVLHADGTYRTLLDRGLVERGDGGAFHGLIGSVSDVTLQREMETALRQSEANFRLLADSMPQIVWAGRPSGVPDYLNRRWYEYSGQSAGEVGFHNWKAMVHPDDLMSSLEKWEHCVATGETFRTEQRLRDKAGKYRWFLCRAAPAFDPESGAILRWFGTATDIDDQKRAADTQSFLAEIGVLLGNSLDLQVTLEQVTRLAVPHLGDWCFVALKNALDHPEMVAAAHLEPEKIAAFWKRHRKYGFDPQASKGFPYVIRTGQSELIEAVDDAMWREALPGQSDYQSEVGQGGHRSTLVVPLEVRGHILGAIGFSYAESGRNFSRDDLPLAQEIARRAAIAIENARLYQRLQDADARKDEFLAMLAHELRNPLAAISGASTLLDMMLDGNSKIETATPRAILTRQTAQLARLVDDLMDVSRITRGKIELRLQNVDFGAILRSALDGVRPLILARRHDLRIEVPPQPIMVEADPTRLGQIVSNLATNAAKYTDSGGKITVSLETSDSEAIFRVKDNGTGLKSEMLSGIWDLFVQSDRTLDRAQGGLGIGLTLVKSLTEMHGGRVEAHSEGVGLGCEFVVALPLIRSATEAAPDAKIETLKIAEREETLGDAARNFTDNRGATKNEARETQATKNHRSEISSPTSGATKNQVLVVDDNRDAASMLCAWLESQGYDVQVANDGAHGLALACGWQPDVALLDVGMPGMDGYAVARQLRALPEGAAMRLIAITGYGQPGDKNQALQAGFDFHLTKPVEFQQLKQVLES
ncbi:PAS domain S-box-containing protein [Abditibacterium utsteinense]|uniref:histidine kinase n=1 Tax=Abditibacterium utsteinense TaxID=1960156 RepID=A0A2S8SQS8_9BACT|nr:PAS domain-containing protein [Abditibacterium utsteinense]PQV63136.1 PAS domain S-box-containing protein [Abditibacterium utsteinense]